MPRISPRERHSDRGPLVILGIFFFVALGVATAAVLFPEQLGLVAPPEPPPVEKKKEGPKPLPEGFVRVPVSVEEIPAYTRVDREHLIHEKTRRLAEVAVSAEALPEDVLLRADKIRGRVLRNDKRAGFVFRERDFYPKGTRAGFVAEVKPSERALLIDRGRVGGLDQVVRRGQFDLVAIYPTPKPQPKPTPDVAGSLDRRPPKAETSRVIVENARVIQVNGSKGAIVVAIPADVATEALEQLESNAKLVALARSGQLSNVDIVPASVSVEEDASESRRFSVIEEIRGGERRFVRVPFAESSSSSSGVTPAIHRDGNQDDDGGRE